MIFASKICSPLRKLQQGVAGFGLSVAAGTNFGQGSCVACSLMPAKHGEKRSNIKSDSLAD